MKHQQLIPYISCRIIIKDLFRKTGPVKLKYFVPHTELVADQIRTIGKIGPEKESRSGFKTGRIFNSEL